MVIGDAIRRPRRNPRISRSVGGECAGNAASGRGPVRRSRVRLNSLARPARWRDEGGEVFALGGGRARPDFEHPAATGSGPGPAGETQPVPGEHLAVVELARGADGLDEPGFQVGAGNLFERRAQFGRGEAARAAIPRVRETNPVVERLRATGEAADVRVEQEGDDVALAVVADRGLARAGTQRRLWGHKRIGSGLKAQGSSKSIEISLEGFA